MITSCMINMWRISELECSRMNLIVIEIMGIYEKIEQLSADFQRRTGGICRVQAQGQLREGIANCEFITDTA